MKRNIFWATVGTIGLCVITTTITLGIVRSEHKKIGVVDAIELFNSYKMKKDMEASDGAKLELMARRIDSIQNVLKILSNSPNGKQEGELLYRQYQLEQANLERQYEQSNHSINEQVWKTLNPLIDKYAHENSLRLMVGANGMGSVLFFDDYYNHTQALIDYVNKHYEKGL